MTTLKKIILVSRLTVQFFTIGSDISIELEHLIHLQFSFSNNGKHRTRLWIKLFQVRNNLRKEVSLSIDTKGPILLEMILVHNREKIPKII